MKPITVYCPVNGTGYGIAASNMFDTVVQKDMVNLVPYWDNIDPPDGVSESFRNAAAEGIKRRPEYGRSPIAFILCHANLLTAPNQRKVGYTFFELNKFKSEELSVMQSIEAVGTASHWGVQVLGNYLDVPTFRIPCGVDTKFFSPGEPESTIEYPEGTRFVSIGKFEKRKGHETILSVLRNWSGNPIVINAFWNNPFLGPPPTLPNKIIRSGFRFVEEKDAYKVFQSGKARLYLHRSIHGRHYMRDRIRDSQFGLYPSAAEGWNLSLLECMSSGVAPITTDVTAHADFADPCILVDTYKEPAFDGRFFKDPRILWDAVIPDRLKQILIEATEGRYDYHKIGSNCRKQALQMDWSNTHKQVEAFIRHLENTL